MIIIISNNLEILLQENLERAPISWSANHVLSYENDFFSSPYVTLSVPLMIDEYPPIRTFLRKFFIDTLWLA